MRRPYSAPQLTRRETGYVYTQAKRPFFSRDKSIAFFSITCIVLALTALTQRKKIKNLASMDRSHALELANLRSTQRKDRNEIVALSDQIRDMKLRYRIENDLRNQIVRRELGGESER
ncbi:hypothetical protein BJ508DRAFT_324561 [Ascobolus immersus RN42]|uniref:Uncharacterized protein n=1 Tax=Ascobolus immersus RN42 TaxID=1160509 RepID=A0A3N4IPJ1_ASCIM|nr:hypothetical protein BJ508DRAFT_324561 [Ascobolus immersus RN42]